MGPWKAPLTNTPGREVPEDDLPPLYGFVKPAKTIGRMKAFHGHFGGGFVRSFTYIAMHGPDGLKDISQYAVLNANYLAARLRELSLPVDNRPLRPHVTLARHAGQVLSREQLIEQVWGYDYYGDTRAVDSAIKRLRARLRAAGGDPAIISTVRGTGYRLERH